MGEKIKEVKEVKVVEEKKEVAEIKNDFSIQQLLSEAVAKGVPVETMERLLVMRRELKAEQALEAFNSSMAIFQRECPIIKKDKVVMNKDKTTARYKFAPLESIIRQTRTLIEKNGFAYSFDTKTELKTVKVFCKVTHILGHEKVSEFQVDIDPESYMNAQQKYASALTFAKRYAFCNAFGILTGDTDNDAKSNDKEEKSSYQKVLEIIKSSKTVGNLIKTDELVKSSQNLNTKEKEQLSKMIKDKVGEIEKNG
ncbi:MAG: ERF family protein [Patescibacteria group bacterium]